MSRQRSKLGWNPEDYLEQEAQRWLQENHSGSPLTPITPEEWVEARTFSEARLKSLNYKNTNYNPRLVKSKLEDINPRGSYTKPITVLDIETDDLGNPITISAVKVAINRNTGKAETIDTYERFYQAKDKNLFKTKDVHGLSSDLLNKLRKQQGALYEKKYNIKEESLLREFLGDSIVAGHNVIGFDLRQLFRKKPISNQVIDTLVAARNMFGDTGENSLDKVFKRFFNVTMEEAGLPHHESMSDTLATTMVLNAMLLTNTSTGSALRKILRSNVLNLVPYDSMLDSQLSVARYYAPNTPSIYLEKKMADMTEEEMLSRNIGTSMQIPKEGFYNPPPGDSEDVSLQVEALANTIKDLSRALSAIKESSMDITGFASTISRYGAASRVNMLSRLDPSDMEAAAETLGVSDKKELNNLISTAQSLQDARINNSNYAELLGYYRRGLAGDPAVEELKSDLYNYWPGWRSEHAERLDRLDRIYKNQRKKRLDQKVQDAVSAGYISEKDAEYISSLGYDKMSAALNDAIESTKLFSRALKSIPFYDFRRWANTWEAQGNGVFASARGVAPSLLLNPMSRMFTAGMESYRAWEAPVNAGLGIFQAASPLVGAAIGGLPGYAVGSGIGALASQIVGNVGEAKINKVGYQMRSQLDVLGSIIGWVSVPFKLLHDITKKLIGSFGNLSFRLNNLMAGGLSEMSDMGNPLTMFTGVGLGKYQRTQLLDTAALLSKGSVNTAIENMAYQQRALYTLGEVNKNRLIAASMLGVYNDIYSADGSVPKDQQYYRAINTILNNKGMSDFDKIRWAKEIDDVMPQLLQTAMTLGVKDIRQLYDPSYHRMYFRELNEGERSRFQLYQYQYGIAQSSLGNSKMRIAGKLWDAFGRDFYNGALEVIDRISDGDWKGAWDGIVDIVNTAGDKLKTAWDKISTGFQESTGKELTLPNVIETAWDKIKEFFDGDEGKGLVGIVSRGALKIYTVWDNLLGMVFDRLTEFLAWFNSISIDWKQMLPGGDMSKFISWFGKEGFNKDIPEWAAGFEIDWTKEWRDDSAALSEIFNSIYYKVKWKGEDTWEKGFAPGSDVRSQSLGGLKRGIAWTESAGNPWELSVKSPVTGEMIPLTSDTLDRLLTWYKGMASGKYSEDVAAYYEGRYFGTEGAKEVGYNKAHESNTYVRALDAAKQTFDSDVVSFLGEALASAVDGTIKIEIFQDGKAKYESESKTPAFQTTAKVYEDGSINAYTNSAMRK